MKELKGEEIMHMYTFKCVFISLPLFLLLFKGE